MAVADIRTHIEDGLIERVGILRWYVASWRDIQKGEGVQSRWRI